ncbi:FMN reductase [Halobacteriales archaeon QS_8_69_26]|nr:MAG: FMN reductase [Halobacteriales archaeon QS_8_69_26]
MNDTPHVVAVSGSLRDESTTRTALAPVLAAAELEGATTELIDLRDYDLPLYGSDGRDAGDAPELRRRIREADAVVLGSPIYHGTIASPLKTALDYCGFDEFENTLVGIVVTAGGRFPTPAILHLRTAARWVRAWVHPTHVGIPDASDHVDPGEGVDDEYADRLEDLGADVARYAAIGRLPELREQAEADPITSD